MHNPTTCSELARAGGAALSGTAPMARAYLLVAFPGPWPNKPFADNTIDPVAGQDIVDRAADEGVRPLFIRRPGSAYAPHQRQFQWAVADATNGTSMWHQHATLAEIAAAPWPHAASATRAPSDEPIYLVCTHGRRDQCCATRGRPVAASFAALRREQTWECSHVGGHRLASVVVALPRGDVYGRVDPEDALSIINATDRGEVHLPRLRGSSLDEPAVQVAKAEVMRSAQTTAARALAVTAYVQRDDTTWLVEVRSVGERASGWRVLVEQRPIASAPASCGKPPEPMHSWSAEVTPR